MKAQLKVWFDRIDAMSLRERALIFGMLAVVIVALGFNLAIDPLSARQKTLNQQLQQQRAQISAVQAQMAAILEAVKNDPDAPNRARLADLQTQIKATQQSLASVQQGFVAPADMAHLLRDLLAKNARIKLVSMKSVAPSAVTGALPTDGKTPPAKPDVAEAPLFYKHGIEITIEGAYPDLVSYLAELERMPWRVYWGSAKLAVEQYPVSRLTLTVFTLNVEKTWLAV